MASVYLACKKAFVSTGTNIHLSFVANPWSEREAERVVTNDTVDFTREPGKVSTALVTFNSNNFFNIIIWQQSRSLVFLFVYSSQDAAY